MNIPYQFGIKSSATKEYDYNEAHAKKVKALLKLKDSELIINAGRHYIKNFIPTPVENEDIYWMCSTFPGNYNTPLRFNIYWHEVLNIHESEKSKPTSPQWKFLIFTSKDFLTPVLVKQLQIKIKGLKFDSNPWYETGLKTQLAAKLPINSYFDFVSDESIYESIRQYNYLLSCKGKKVHKGHNYELARLLLK